MADNSTWSGSRQEKLSIPPRIWTVTRDQYGRIVDEGWIDNPYVRGKIWSQLSCPTTWDAAPPFRTTAHDSDDIWTIGTSFVVAPAPDPALR